MYIPLCRANRRSIKNNHYRGHELPSGYGPLGEMSKYSQYNHRELPGNVSKPFLKLMGQVI